VLRRPEPPINTRVSAFLLSEGVQPEVLQSDGN
jgi:hypothetical protein